MEAQLMIEIRVLSKKHLKSYRLRPFNLAGCFGGMIKFFF